MKLLPLILLVAMSGCGVTLIDATEYRLDGTCIRTRVIGAHFLSDPNLAHAQHGSLSIDGFQGKTAVESVKAVVSGVVQAILKTVVPIP